MQLLKVDPAEQIAHEAKKHSQSQKVEITKSRKPFRKQDIEFMNDGLANIRSVLCVGCRDGSELIDFLDAGFFVTGIDVANESEYVQIMDAHEMDQHLNFRRYDVVYLSHALEHMHDPVKVMTNIRKLEPRGVFMVLPLIPIPTNGQPDAVPSLDHPCLFDIMNQANTDWEHANDVNSPIWQDFKPLEPYRVVQLAIRDLMPMYTSSEIIIFMQLHYDMDFFGAHI
jgi:hypothetical protein